jgi:hypothetical protein
MMEGFALGNQQVASVLRFLSLQTRVPQRDATVRLGAWADSAFSHADTVDSADDEGDHAAAERLQAARAKQNAAVQRPSG